MAARHAASRRKSIDETQPVDAQFKLPSISDRADTIDFLALVDRAFARFADDRDAYLSDHVRTYGGSRNYTVVYSQKTHDQIQAQIRSLYMLAARGSAANCARLEHAFQRIDNSNLHPREWLTAASSRPARNMPRERLSPGVAALGTATNRPKRSPARPRRGRSW